MTGKHAKETEGQLLWTIGWTDDDDIALLDHEGQEVARILNPERSTSADFVAWVAERMIREIANQGSYDRAWVRATLRLTAAQLSLTADIPDA